jgi:hypothetical protein
VTETLIFSIIAGAILIFILVYLPSKNHKHQQAFHAAQLEKFQCDRCGCWFPKEEMTMVMCEGLFCRVCLDIIESTPGQDEFIEDDDGGG